MNKATLEQLDDVLSKINGLAQLGGDRYVADALVRWSIERLWIFAGNLADRHRRDLGLDLAVTPWSDLVGARNVYAHYLPDQVSYDRIWYDTTMDLPHLRHHVKAVLRDWPETGPT